MQRTTEEDHFLGLGSPRFAAARAESVSGPQLRAAWHEVFAGPDPREALARVGGDFAVGLRDAGGRVVLAVDRFAVQTLCYRVVDGQLRFAARADALADADAALDPQAIFDYLYF